MRDKTSAAIFRARCITSQKLLLPPSLHKQSQRLTPDKLSCLHCKVVHVIIYEAFIIIFILTFSFFN